MDIETEPRERTLPELAEEYVLLLSSTPNAWGQHVHPIYSQSHNLLKVMQDRFGKADTNRAIDAAFHRQRKPVHQH